MKNILIIGGGIAGVSAANYLEENKRKDINYLLFEKESILGGLCRTVCSNGFFYDYTGHLLHFSDEQNKQFVSDLLGEKLQSKIRKSFIYFRKRYIDFPFQQNLGELPDKEKKECLWSYLEAYFNLKKGSKCEFFKNWTQQMLGAGISKYFMIPYNEKLWHVSAQKLTTTWMQSYVPPTDLQAMLEGIFKSGARKNKIGYNGKFYYPQSGGIQTLIKVLEQKVDSQKIKRGCQIKEIDLKNKVVTDNNGHRYNYDYLITSVPLKELVLKNIKDVTVAIKNRAKVLKTNSILNINLGVKRKLEDRHWIYFPERQFVFYRIGYISNFSSTMCPPGCGSIYVEISLNENFNFNNKKVIDKYVGRAIKDLIKAQIIKSKKEIVDITILPIKHAYVTYDKNRDQNVSQIIEYLEKRKVYSVGRYGRWEYSDMEKAMVQGREIAKQILDY